MQSMIYQILIGFIMFIAIVSGISVFTGWYYLAIEHPYRGTKIELEAMSKISFQTLYIGFLGSYKNCINFYICEEGIILKPIWIFAYMHKPIFIKWDEIQSPTNGGYISKNIKFKLASKTLRVYGKSSQEIIKILNSH